MKSRNGCTPEQNSKVFNALASGLSVGVLSLVLLRNPEGAKAVQASISAPTPAKKTYVVVPALSTPDRVQFALERIESRVRSLYPSDADAILTFIRTHLQYAIADPCPSFCLAQGGLESDWGRSYLAQRNNFFGIKGLKPLSEYGPEVHALLAPAGTVRRKDREEGSNDPYFCFKDVESCYVYRARNLGRLRYRRQINSIQERSYFREWVEAVHKGGWATDKAYTDKVCKLIEDLEFYLLDN